jgi:hypothetical protein
LIDQVNYQILETTNVFVPSINLRDRPVLLFEVIQLHRDQVHDVDVIERPTLGP